MPGTGSPPFDLTATSWIRELPRIRARLEREGRVALLVPDPDAGDGRWRGEPDPEGVPLLGLRDWLDLADALGARLATPRPRPARGSGGLVLTLERLGEEAALHGGDPDERYGVRGSFARVRKTALPGFRLPLLDALRFASGSPAAPALRALVVGCHRGDELEVLAAADPPLPPERVVGVDRNDEALATARARFPVAAFVHADLEGLARGEPLPVEGRFDLVVAVAVLQSPRLDGPAVLRGLVRHHASARGGLIIGLPASRFRDGEVLWGARTRNFTEPDLSLVVRDLAGHRRYLHQHGYRTRIGGRYDLLLAARREAGGEDVIMRP